MSASGVVIGCFESGVALRSFRRVSRIREGSAKWPTEVAEVGEAGVRECLVILSGRCAVVVRSEQNRHWQVSQSCKFEYDP